MHVALRERNHNAVLFKKIGNSEANLTAKLAQDPIAGYVAPEVRIEDQGIVTKVLKNNAWGWLLFDFWLACYGLHNQVRDLAHRRSIGNADTNGSTNFLIDKCPVNDRILQEQTVRHEQVHSVSTADARRPISDSLNDTLDRFKFDVIVNTDWTFSHQDPAADKIIDDVLRAKADANRYRAGREGKGSQWNSKQSQRRDDDEYKNREKHDSLDDMHDVGTQLGRCESSPNQKADEATAEIAESEQQENRDQLPYGNRLTIRRCRQHAYPTVRERPVNQSI